MVYLPYEYEKDKKYDILYLMHGRGGSYKTWLGVPKRPGTFKNILDNMIENGDTKPMIVVAPNLAYEFGTDNRIMIGTEHEIVDSLMPAVESSFSTYAVTATPDGFQASRDHRYFAGFSMGGSLTWHMLRDHVDYFRYFIPMSMATYYDKKGYSERKSLVASEKTKKRVQKSGYGPDDFEVYAATGDADYKADATAMQVYDLTDDKNFIYSEGTFKKGNITFKVWPGEWHSYKNSYPYLYNALKSFKQ
jgi:endo-1,4-beta-xylanase